MCFCLVSIVLSFVISSKFPSNRLVCDVKVTGTDNIYLKRPNISTLTLMLVYHEIFQDQNTPRSYLLIQTHSFFCTRTFFVKVYHYRNFLIYNIQWNIKINKLHFQQSVKKSVKTLLLMLLNVLPDPPSIIWFIQHKVKGFLFNTAYPPQHCNFPDYFEGTVPGPSLDIIFCAIVLFLIPSNPPV